MATVGIRCDSDVEHGVGHLIRCVALAEELRGRGVEVIFIGDVYGSGWARTQLYDRGLSLIRAPHRSYRLAELAGELGLDAMVLDSYKVSPRAGAALRAAGVPVMAIVDGDPRGQEADLYVDQNLGAEDRPFTAPGERLAGSRYVLLRDSVRNCTRVQGQGDGRRILCFFGGTDSARIAPVWAEALNETWWRFEATVVSHEPFEVEGDRITVIPPTNHLAERMAAADLVITAAGSAVWELLYLGVPSALTWVADNQRIGYDELVGKGIAAGLGREPDAEAMATLRRLLVDPALREEHGRRGAGLVDGKGRERVADALLDLK
jgi:spore coat polysaccharide biosynthesis predicted glycosyltransferase SpsG